MNTNILNKCIEELDKEVPRLDYIRGMLETLVEVQDVKTVISTKSSIRTTPVYMPPAVVLTDEAAILDEKAREAMKTIKLAEQTE